MKTEQHFEQTVMLNKIKNRVVLRQAFQHNLRELPYELHNSKRINPEMTSANWIIQGERSSSELMRQHTNVIESADLPRKLRSDAVLGIEVVLSLPIEHSVAEADYFEDCLRWAKEFFTEHIVSAVVHKDESCPHCHIILVPLINGRMQGSKLYGYKARLRHMQDSFYDSVGRKYGLVKPSDISLYRGEAFKNMAVQLWELLCENPSLMTDPDVRMLIIQIISRRPLEVLELCQLKLLSNS
jgi:Plasmid recombination enzyme